MHLKLLFGKEILLTQFSGTEQANVKLVMQSLKTSHSEIYDRWCDADGKLRESLTIFVNGDHIRYHNGLDTMIEEGDEIYIVPLITGG